MSNSKLPDSYDVACVGGGVIGLMTAYELANAGLKVAVIDRGPVGREASWAGAGIISPANMSVAQTPYDRLRAYSYDRFPSLAAAIREMAGIDIGYRQTGAIELDSSGDIHHGLTIPEFCQVRNPWLLRGLVEVCRILGVHFIENVGVTAIDVANGKVNQLQLVTGQRIAAQHVVVAAGAWSAALFEPLGRTLPIKPIRGQIVALQSDGKIVRHIILDGKRYLVPRDDGLVLVGSTEEDVGFQKQTTDDAIAELMDFAYGLFPDLRTAKVVASWAGLRPGCALGTPVIEPVPKMRNLWLAAGHFREGIQLAPGTARLLTDWILGRPTFAAENDFSLEADRSNYHRPFES